MLSNALVPFQERFPELKYTSISIELGAMKTAPIWEQHQRGKNWCAIINKDPRSPGGLRRVFLPVARGDYYYMIEGLAPKHVVEFGADYYSGGGRKTPCRWYGVVAEITEDHILFFTTGLENIWKTAEDLKTFLENTNPPKEKTLEAQIIPVELTQEICNFLRDIMNEVQPEISQAEILLHKLQSVKSVSNRLHAT